MIKAIDIDNLICSYDKRPVLKNVTFSVQKGDMFIVIGPNGSGKTTLMKAMAGIRGFENGSVDVLGRNISGYSKKILAQAVALVPQEGPLDFPFTVNELVLMGRSPYLGILGLPREEDFEIAGRALAFTGVENLAHRKLDQLSGGEKQLVFIARAICQEPQIIILDEPTASLDLAHQIKIMDLMEKLKLEKGVTVVMVSHDVNLAAMYGDTLLLLKDGEVVNLGPPGEVITFEMLEEAYGCTLLVDESPLGKVPRVTPVPHKYMT